MQFTTSLTNNYEFRRLYAKGRSAVTPTLVIYTRRGRGGVNRVGFTVTTKLGKAVVRNRIRRRLREIYRLNEARFSPGWDIVVVARSKAVTASFDALQRGYLSLARKAGLLRPQEDKP